MPKPKPKPKPVSHLALRRWRHDLGLTQAHIAKYYGVSVRAWKRWEAPPRVASSRPVPSWLARAVRTGFGFGLWDMGLWSVQDDHGFRGGPFKRLR